MATLTPYHKWKRRQLTGGANTVDFDTDTIKVMLLTNAYTPSTGSSGHEFLSDVDSNQVAIGTGYTGPVTLTSITVNDSGTDVVFDAADISVPKDTGGGFANARYLVIYKDTGTAATSPLVFLGDFVTNQSNTAGVFDITWSASGIFKI